MKRLVNCSTALALVTSLMLLGTGCLRSGVGVPLSPDLMRAQLLLETFRKALGDWDLATLNSIIVGGAAHPGWAAQRKSFEGRGIRFAEVLAGQVKPLTTRIAVGLVRFRLTGAGAISTDRVRAARVALLKTVDGWQVSFWGTKRVIKRHLMWIAKGGDPLQDPLFSVLP